MSAVIKAEAVLAAIKDVIKHKLEQLALEVDPARKARAEDHLKQAQADLALAEKAHAEAVAADPSLASGVVVGAPVPAKA